MGLSDILAVSGEFWVSSDTQSISGAALWPGVHGNLCLLEFLAALLLLYLDLPLQGGVDLGWV